MDLSDNHKAELIKFLKFFKIKKNDIVQEITDVAEEFQDEDIDEELYNGDDVKEKIDDFSKKIKIHCSSEIDNLLQMTAVYVKYCMSISQQCGADIEINLNLIEDAKLKSEVGEISSGNYKRTSSIGGVKLPPVAYGNQLQEKIDDLEKKLKAAETKSMGLQKELIGARKAGAGAMFGGDEMNENNGASTDEVNHLKMKISELESLVDQKLSGSTQLQNLKKMLMTKNSKLKEYRQRLVKYEALE